MQLIPSFEQMAMIPSLPGSRAAGFSTGSTPAISSSRSTYSSCTSRRMRSFVLSVASSAAFAGFRVGVDLPDLGDLTQFDMS